MRASAYPRDAEQAVQADAAEAGRARPIRQQQLSEEVGARTMRRITATLDFVA